MDELLQLVESAPRWAGGGTFVAISLVALRFYTAWRDANTKLVEIQAQSNRENRTQDATDFEAANKALRDHILFLVDQQKDREEELEKVRNEHHAERLKWLAEKGLLDYELRELQQFKNSVKWLEGGITTEALRRVLAMREEQDAKERLQDRSELDEGF